MPERINGGQVLVVLGAIALIVSLFLHWYEPNRSAWIGLGAALVLAAGALLSRARVSVVITLKPNEGTDRSAARLPAPSPHPRPRLPRTTSRRRPRPSLSLAAAEADGRARWPLRAAHRRLG